MTADVELLPLPENVEVDKHLPTGVRIYAYDATTLKNYALANVAHAILDKDAEIDAMRTLLEDTVRDSTNKIEALRAEVALERNLKADAIHACALVNIHAERMAEALREATAMLLADYPETAKRLRAEADLLRGNRRKGSE